MAIAIEVGQCVAISDHECGIVLEAAKLLTGEPIYKVLRAFDDQGDGGVTYTLAATANEPGGPRCAECPLWYEGRCGLPCLA
ncbi:MAG: hypothetical protein E5W93_12310 [Mesorhizobium sp.]|nr:MAG: hypothetical protein E5W93_12310 [Mesorhizobium sp.]